jgi:hypothetical protein
VFESAALQSEKTQVPPMADLYHRALDEVKEHPAEAIGVAAVLAVGSAIAYVSKGVFCDLAEPEMTVYKGIGEFACNGRLKPGLYKASFEEFAGRFGTNPERLHLLQGFQAFAHNVGLAGCEEIRIGGSFVSDKAVPDDFDALWRFTDSIDKTKLDQTLLTDSRFDSRFKFGGDVYSTRTKKLDMGSFLPRHKSIFRWVSEDPASNPIGAVSIDPRTVPAPADFRPATYGPHLGPQDWLRR